ncbi:MAG: DUF1553 domain-containing protein [Acidobacteriota bacterium]|nr:DUF1553 domain-containing protein [Acidobacteriota bacterium]
MLTTLILLGLLAACWWHSPDLVSAAVATQEPSREGVEFFESKIRPVLAEQCYMCHSAKSKKPQGGLVLDTRDGMLKGGASGVPAVVPGEPEKSLLMKAIRHEDAKLQMPPGGQLTAEQMKDFEAWIKMGAPDPRTLQASAETPWPADDLKVARAFWSLQPIKDPPAPSVKDTRWAKSAIDRFILAGLEKKNLRPVRDADKRTLIRRATFDLIGLPPAPVDVEVFLQDRSPTAFEKVIDRLLASTHYGERWGRHWLDVARYADTSGCNSDFPVPSAYKYRNYVIKSFNDDKPYDQFVREQIAGDLLKSSSEAERQERVVATGYLALARRFGSRNNEFHLTIDDTIDNVGKSVLGLSVSCARCHDHKFDPIPTKDYYALYGIFNSTRYAFPGTEIYRHTKDFIPLAPSDEGAKLVKWQTELAGLDDRLENLNVERAALERKAKSVKASAEKAAVTDTGKNDNKESNKQGAEIKVQKDGEKKDNRESKDGANTTTRTLTDVKGELAEVKARIAEMENQPPNVEKAYAVTDGAGADARIHGKGDPKSKGDEAPRAFLQVLGGQRLPDKHSGSGRLELAHWLTDPKSPLTARVMVNRIWQHHFGKGIVQTANDFGVRGKAPTHPELLDYLASRFIESKWSVKKMHRLMMLSRAYQLSSVDDPRHAAVDVNNDLLWKFSRRRLDAEEVRDAMLAVSGTLDKSEAGAHPFPPESAWRYTQHKPFVANYDSNYDSDRRSVYLMQQRIRKQPFLEVFDGADTNATTAERPISTTPIQALFMMNDPFTHRQADSFAVRVGMAFAAEMERIDYAYRLVFGRPATLVEIRLGATYLRQIRAEMKNTGLPADQQGRAALASYARVLLSSNEFMFID